MDPTFNYQRYLRPGITKDEIICIRKSFLNLGPQQNGNVPTSKILDKYENAYEMQELAS
jgi:hypothetical protein